MSVLQHALFVSITVLVAGGCADARAQTTASERLTTMAVRAENDVVGATDGNYTSGASMTLAREGRGLLGGIWRVFGLADARLVSGYEVGQLIVTPSDIKRRVPDPHDRPYAGLLYLAASTHAIRGNRFDGLKLITGIVGPSSLAEQTQKAVHRWIGSPEPQGWKYQLANEPILNAVYEHRRRYALPARDRGWGAELIPMIGGMLGNVLIQAQGETQFRFGYNLPDDFGATLMRGLGNLPYPLSHHDRTAHRFGVYVFAAGGGNLVARNLTLDGSTFHESPRVQKKPAFGAGEAGVAVWTPRWHLTFTYVMWGREFDAQGAASRYGAATMAVHF